MKQDRLQSLVRLAQAKEQAAVKLYIDARAANDLNQQRLQELISYRDEYQQPGESNSLSPVLFQSRRVFLGQLCTAIDQQEMQLVNSQAFLEQQQQSWRKLQIKRQSIEKLIAKGALQQAVIASRQEQKELDEITQYPDLTGLHTVNGIN
ncbi:MAG: flagellar export protein FliJ [Pseudomonadales bacterium]|nr:flagellar export protein FliJ [Pseudomonadales bacterium]